MLLFARIRFRVHVFYHGLGRNIEFCVGARRIFVRAARVCRRGMPRWCANHAFCVGATLRKLHFCCYCTCKDTFQNSCVLPWFRSQHRVSYKRAVYLCEGCHCVSPGWRANYAFRAGATLRKVDCCCYLQGYVSECVCFTMV